MSTETTTAAPDESQTGVSSDTDEDTITTLKEQAPPFECHITETATVNVSKSMNLDPVEGRIFEDDTYSRPHWDTVSVEDYYCSHCREGFETEEEAKSHLRRQYYRWRAKYQLPGIPGSTTEEVEGTLTVDDELEEFDVDGLPVVGATNSSRSAAVVRDGVSGLIATSRRAYSIPENFEFDDWESLDDGQLTTADGAPRLKKRLLKKTIDYLSTSYNQPYDPKNYTLYDRGESVFLLVANGEAIVIAPTVTKSSS